MTAQYYRDQRGRIRVPLFRIPYAFEGAHILKAFPYPPEEQKALENFQNFSRNILILLGRLKTNLYRFGSRGRLFPDFDELFLDTQCFFLIVQQLLEDVALINRECVAYLIPELKHQVKIGFRKQVKWFSTYQPSQDLRNRDLFIAVRDLFTNETEWIEKLGDIRDDISHRTSIWKQRGAEFPDFITFITAAAGEEAFADQKDGLVEYIKLICIKLFNFLCRWEDLILQNLKKTSEPAKWFVGAVYCTPNSSRKLELGVIRLTISTKDIHTLKYFLSCD